MYKRMQSEKKKIGYQRRDKAYCCRFPFRYYFFSIFLDVLLAETPKCVIIQNKPIPIYAMNSSTSYTKNEKRKYILCIKIRK